jgi:novobiocin biosynthesis protein NovU
MEDIIRVLGECRVCGQDDWLDVMSFGTTPLANGLLEPAPDHSGEPKYPMDVVVCRSCWLMSLRHVVDPEALFRYFVWVSSDSDQIARHMEHIADWATARAGLVPGDLVVEMGSNIGTQLEVFGRRGLRTVGVDPARNLAAIANENGFETYPEFMGPEVTTRIAAEHGKAKFVLGRQCFAHIDDVHHVLDGVDAVLADDGVFAIEVPYLLDLLDESQFDTIYHEHLSYYSLGTFGTLFERHGFDVIAVERAQVHGGSIIVFAARAEAGRRPDPGVAELVALEARRGLDSERRYREFAESSRRVITAVGDLVRGLVADGARIAAYGAPSKGTTLLMFCELTEREIEFASDTTSFKQGKVLPGSHVPVLSPEQARAQQPDYYLLLAWNYAEEIIGKEREFLDRGGKFIVPIPEPVIVSAETVHDQEYRRAG